MLRKPVSGAFGRSMPSSAFVSLALAACLFLGACAMQPLAPEKAAHYKRVGVLSAMGKNFEIRIAGPTVFDNKVSAREMDIGADEQLTKKVIKALADRYTVVDLSKYRQAFMDHPKSWRGGDSAKPSVPDVVRDLMGKEGLDAYILVTPGAASVQNTNQAVGGIGIVRAGNLFGSDKVNLYAAYIVSVIDGKDYSLVADMRAARTVRSNPFGINNWGKINAPSLRVPATYLESPSKYKKQIRNLFGSLMNQSVPETLRQANLLPAAQ